MVMYFLIIIICSFLTLVQYVEPYNGDFQGFLPTKGFNTPQFYENIQNLPTVF